MQWLANTLNGLVTQYPEGKNLQRSGVVSRENLLQFFEKGLEMFDSAEVKSQLKLAFAQRKDVPDIITNMQKAIFEDIGIQGDFAINFLADVQQIYGNDQEVMARFFYFVSREEMACDEAEMTESEFAEKYAAALAAQEEIKKKSAELDNLTPEQRKEFLEKMLQQSGQLLNVGGCQTCSNSCSCDAPPTNQSMTADEQLEFFQKLSNKPS